jgi:hypothetical protein
LQPGANLSLLSTVFQIHYNKFLFLKSISMHCMARRLEGGALHDRQDAKGSRINKFTFWRERRAGRCKAARRRRCGTSSRSANAADARPPPRPEGLPAPIIAMWYVILSHENKDRYRQQNAKLFFARALSTPFYKYAILQQ